MIKFLKTLHQYYFYLCVFVTFALLFPFYYFLLKEAKYYPLINKIRTVQCKIICFLTGFILKIKGLNPLPTDRNYIYCANHTATLDILLMCILAKGNFHFMGKTELLENPILRLFFSTIDIPVDRKSIRSSFKAFKMADENLKKGMSLIIFPEGKIPDEYPPLLAEFKNGPFKLAIENKVPIIPITFINIWKLFWDDGKKYGTKPGFCNIFVHPIIPTAQLQIEDAEDLKEEVYQQIKKYST